MSLVLRDAIARGASELDVASSEEQNSLLAELLQAVLKANERINIIGPCTVEEAVERHILDSLALMRLIQHVPRIRSWIDVGTGGGFPGLVWAVMRSDLDFLLVDSVSKKAALVRKHAIELGLANVKVRPGRFEDLTRPTEAVGLVSRATFAPQEWVARASEFLACGGAVVATMGGQADTQLVARSAHTERLSLPLSGLERTNILVEVKP